MSLLDDLVKKFQKKELTESDFMKLLLKEKQFYDLARLSDLPKEEVEHLSHLPFAVEDVRKRLDLLEKAVAKQITLETLAKETSLTSLRDEVAKESSLSALKTMLEDGITLESDMNHGFDNTEVSVSTDAYTLVKTVIISPIKAKILNTINFEVRASNSYTTNGIKITLQVDDGLEETISEILGYDIKTTWVLHSVSFADKVGIKHFIGKVYLKTYGGVYTIYNRRFEFFGDKKGVIKYV